MVFGAAGFAEQRTRSDRFSEFGAIDSENVPVGETYVALLREIMRFFQTGVPPVTAEETIEMFAFMEAADESKRRGGQPVRLSEVVKRAERRQPKVMLVG
jgi:hypothetical protein